MGSMLNDVISAVLKLAKGTDTMQRILSLKALSQKQVRARAGRGGRWADGRGFASKDDLVVL